MNTIQRVAKNTLALSISSLTGLLLGSFYLMYAARYLGSENFGILSLAIAFSSILAYFGDLGLATLITRDVARDRGRINGYLGNAALIKLFLAIIVYLAGINIAKSLNYSPQTIHILSIILASFIISGFANIFTSIFQALEKMELISIGSIINNINMTIGVLFAVYYNLDAISFAYIYIYSSLIFLILNILLYILKIGLPTLELSSDLCVNMMRQAIPFGISVVFINIYYYVNTFIMSFALNNPNEIIGWYNAAYRLVLILAFIPAALLNTLYPLMSKQFISSEESVKSIFEKSFKYLFMIGFPIGIGTTILAEKIILTIYGPEYYPAILSLQILIWSEVIIFLNVTFGNLLNSINRQMVVTKQTMIAAPLNVILNFLFIPLFSYIGASVITVITELFAFCFLFIYCYKNNLKISPNIFTDIFRIVVASSVMGLFIEVFRFENLFIQIFSAIIIYISLIICLKIISDNDLALMRQLIKGAKVLWQREIN